MTKQPELVVMTHHDLDALGCMLNIEYKMPSVPKKYFHTNYADIDQVVAEIERYVLAEGCTYILIADVSFGDNKPALARLYNIALVIHIDHHLYPEGFWDDFPKMKVVHDKTKSATKLCNEFFKNTGANERLDKLSFLIDVYDIWQTEDPAFDLSQDLNEYFWASINYGSLLPLVERIIANDYKLPSDFSDVVKRISNERTNEVHSYESRNLIHRSGDMSICFINNWFNHVMIGEMRAGKNIVIGINSRGIVRVRIREQSPYSTQQKNALRLELTGTETTGHMNAFTYKINPKSFEDLVSEAQRVTCAINKHFSA
jgi:oligoribonuclease NrnB/cAMP/cGMP phosphodiesterase (DHH superfamily)